MKLYKILEQAIWAALILIMFVPVYLDSDFFFPYIFSKALAFRVLVEILLLLWLGYIYLRKEKIKIDWITIIFAILLIFQFISSIFGENFYFSFWSNIERSEGLLLWLHMFVFFVVVKNFIQTHKSWLVLFEAFFLGAQLVAMLGFLQYLGVDFINKTGLGDDRVASTIGNAAYLAGYLLFAFFIGLYLMVIRKNKWLSIYYILAIILDLFIVVQTGTRGALIAFIISVLLFFIYNTFKLTNKKLKYYIVSAGIVFVLFSVFVFLNKDSAFVQNDVALRRITSISLNERTAQTRLMAWGSAWQGFLDEPILGYGQENFSVVFNKYFNPEIYSHAGSQVWFDRAHNIFIDHLIAGGIIGFILYTLFILWPLLLVFKKGIWSKEKVATANFENIGDQIIFLAIFSFIIQGLLVFEAMVTYLPLLMLIAFISYKYQSVKYSLGNTNVLLSIFIVWFVAIFPVMYIVNIKEAKAGLDLVAALRLGESDQAGSMEKYFEVIGRNTSGTNEYRLRAAEALQGFIVNRKFTPYQASEYIDRLEKELNARIESNPKDVPAYLLLMRHYNYVYILDPTKLYKVEELGQKALEYSPTRPQIYYELGYADLYLYQWMKDQSDDAKAQQYKDKMIANFQKAIDLNNDVDESYVNMIMALLAIGQGDMVQNYFDTMDIMNLDYKREESVLRMVNSAIHGEDYTWSATFYGWLIEINPNNPDYYIGKALSYANLGKNDLAIIEAEKVKSFDGIYIEQAEAFIERVKSGYYKK